MFHQLEDMALREYRNRTMKIWMLAAILAGVVSIPALSQNNKASTLNATVLTSSDAPIADAYVLLHDYQVPGHGKVSENWETRTQEDGSFSLVVEPRCYDLFVSKGAMLPYSQRICVGPQPMSKLRIKPRPDPHPRLLVQ